MTEAKPSSSLLGAARVAIALGTIGALAYFAFDLVSIAFRLGTRTGVRSAVGVALPLLAGSYAIVSRRGAPGAMGGPPAAVRFAASLAGGALAMASIRLFLRLLPIPGAELVIASCIAVLTAGFASDARRSMALFLGVAAGMLLYIAVLGVPRVVG